MSDRKYYHGTSRKNAESIHKEGFLSGSKFANDLCEAMTYGAYVFEIWFTNEEVEKYTEYKDFRVIKCSEQISADRIQRFKIYNNKTLYEKGESDEVEWYRLMPVKEEESTMEKDAIEDEKGTYLCPDCKGPLHCIIGLHGREVCRKCKKTVITDRENLQFDEQEWVYKGKAGGELDWYGPKNMGGMGLKDTM